MVIALHPLRNRSKMLPIAFSQSERAKALTTLSQPSIGTTETSDKRDPRSDARPNKAANQQSGCRTLGGCALSDRAMLCWPRVVVFLGGYSWRGLPRAQTTGAPRSEERRVGK